MTFAEFCTLDIETKEYIRIILLPIWLIGTFGIVFRLMYEEYSIPFINWLNKRWYTKIIYWVLLICGYISFGL